MKNIDDLDEEVIIKKVDENEIATQKKKRDIIKKGIRFFVITVITHLGAWILYSFTLHSLILQAIADEQDWYKTVVLVFSLAAICVLAFAASIELSSDDKQRRQTMVMSRTARLKFADTFQLSKIALLEYSAIYFVFQIPFCIFYHAFGYYYVESTIMENFYTMDVGMLELTKVGILGIMLNTLMFAATLMLMRHFIYKRWEKEKI